MKTDELIRALAADRAEAPPAQPGLWPAIGIGLAISALIFAVTLGPRPDVAQAATTLRFLFKPFLMLALAGAGWIVLRRLIQPGAPAPLWLLALIPAALALAAAAELIALPRTAWARAMFGDNWSECVVLIPLLSLAPGIAVLLALRHGAPTRPAVAGAVAGLVASGFGGALYAINCTDDSPLFVATWYTIAVAVMGLAGAIAGRRLLRW